MKIDEIELTVPIELVAAENNIEKIVTLQPQTFNDYIGQADLKAKLKIYLAAAKLRDEALDHLLLFGCPGLGKTTLCQIMANEMNVEIKIISATMLEKAGDLVSILSSLKRKSILFIDEIHRLKKNIEEILYSAMEAFKIDIIIGQGVGAKTISLPIQQFTLIGATTKIGLISAPLRSRFGIIEQIDFYSLEDLTEILIQNSNFFKLKIECSAALLIAKRARGTPRIAKKLLNRVRDFAQVEQVASITEKLVASTMDLLQIDECGFTRLDSLILEKIITHFNGGPVGIDTLAAMIGIDSETLELVYEPFLIRVGYIEKKAKGRQIVRSKLEFLKKKYL